jgi:hypothetical protein
MTLRYHQRGGRLSANYVCQKQNVEQCHPICQNTPGGVVDDALSALIVDSISPLALEVALNVQHQLQERLAEADRLRRQYVERAQYEAEQARIRYMRVDPLCGLDCNVAPRVQTQASACMRSVWTLHNLKLYRD